MKNNRKLLFSLALLLVLLFTLIRFPISGSKRFAKQDIDYNIHIRPILSDKCFVCHGPDAAKREAGLRLDTETGAYAALEDQKDQYVIVPGDRAHSALWDRINQEDTTLLMPPPSSNLRLNAQEIHLLGQWIEQGAKYKEHWAFIPPNTNTNTSEDLDWGYNKVDYYIQRKLKEVGLSPNQEAQKAHLLKRLAFDLTGLPPTVEMQNAFHADDSPEAYEKIIDQLLASPHYGEKMAIHWLDVARYADSHGYQDDGYRSMWPWRDWVIHAFNENYPYDKFLEYQLAGDLLPNPTKEMLLATGFNRNHKITQEGGVIDEEYRVEYVTDRTNTFGKAFLAITFECAKCHDHKYDPISQQDYFSTFAFFNQVPEKGIFGTIDASFADPPNMAIEQKDLEDILAFVNKKDTMPLQVMIMQDSLGMRGTYVLDRGSYDAPTKEVAIKAPKSILEFDTTQFDQNRLGLAQWLLDDKNPLTARVFVNRIWQELFGQGLVKTSGDFGMQGDLPSHPELLDWLAIHFQDNDWDIKQLVKTIVLSATYRQSAETNKRKMAIDPDNIYLARAPRLRLKAEIVKDHILASSGLLNPEIGGPSIKPYQPDGIWEVATSGRGSLAEYVQDHGNDLYRRGMYVFIKRTVPPPAMQMFDASNRDQCEVRRLSTNTPLQALVMLNDPHVLEASRVLAELLIEEHQATEEQILQAFQRIICRAMKPQEIELLNNYYQEEKAFYVQNIKEAKNLLDVGEYPHSNKADPASTAALMQVIHTIYNMEEAITKT
jgi:hypothetical protein